MKKLLMVVAIICLAAPAYAVKTVSFSWEDGISTVMGTGTIKPVNITNVTGLQTGLCGDCAGGTYSCPGAYDGVRYLHLQESPHTGTPEAWIACVTGLENGDVVTAGYYGYDITPGASPSSRVWAHYGSAVTCPDCPGSYVGSAGGPSTYTAGNGWDVSEYTYTMAFPTNAYCFVVQVRLYSSPTTSTTSTTDYWIDKVYVTVPDYASVRFADFGPSAVDNTTWGAIKALFN